MQKRRNSSVLAMELHRFCIKPSILSQWKDILPQGIYSFIFYLQSGTDFFYCWLINYELHHSSHAVMYRKTSSKSRTKSQNLNVSCILLQLSSLNLLKPGVQLIMKM